MCFLSDATIQQYMSQGQLVLDGDPTLVEHNSYQFRSEKIFFPGPEGRVIDWSVGGGEGECRVEPGRLVWVRVRERVRLPTYMCAFWWQTNSLSRQGLMLVNMSMVEPGYEGPLACLFVNFGREPVIIDREMPVAKLVFAEMDREAHTPFRFSASTVAYDRTIRDAALRGPSSFLQVAELTTHLSEEREDALNRIKQQRLTSLEKLERRVKELESELKSTTDEWKKTTVEDLQTDLKSVLLKYIGLPAVAIGVVVLLINLVPQVRAFFRPQLEEQIRKTVAEEVSRRIMVPGTPVVNVPEPERTVGRPQDQE